MSRDGVLITLKRTFYKGFKFEVNLQFQLKRDEKNA